MVLIRSFIAAACLLSGADALSTDLRIGSGGRTIHDFRRAAAAEAADLEKRDLNPYKLYEARFFDIPVDHFQNDPKYAPHNTRTFKNRYWVDTSHYKPGGPVIILQSGETNAIQRTTYMQNGILAKLAEVTGGISVVFEHRYYGHSIPGHNLKTEHLRFLTTEQALADEAYFAQHISFPGYEDQDLSSNTTAYLSYGGSYSGAFSAFLRVKYPDVFWGSISSSGVTKAIYDYWQYYEPVSQYGPPACIAAQKAFTLVTDNVLMRGSDRYIQNYKDLFGLGNVTYSADFANQLAQGVGWWQSLNWDPLVSYPEFYQFCDNITHADVLYPETESKRRDATRYLENSGYVTNGSFVNQMLNYIGWINLTAVSVCASEDLTQDMCFSNLNSTFYQQDDQAQQIWRSWAYQYCTEWGYLQTGSGVPQDQMSLISRTIDLNYTTTVCREAFGIYNPPNVTEANQYGGYDIRHSRLAIIDGEYDPWRPATPHAFQYGAPHRKSTTDEPFILIPKALHHYDENGRFANETTPTLPPPAVASTQMEEQRFARAWMEEWRGMCQSSGKKCS